MGFVKEVHFFFPLDNWSHNTFPRLLKKKKKSFITLPVWPLKDFGTLLLDKICLLPEIHPDSDVVPDSIYPVRYLILFQAVQRRIFKGMKNIYITPAASHEVHS